MLGFRHSGTKRFPSLQRLSTRNSLKTYIVISGIFLYGKLALPVQKWKRDLKAFVSSQGQLLSEFRARENPIALRQEI